MVDREAAEGGHVLQAVSGVDLGGVLGEGGVADEAEPVLDGPLRAGDLCESLRAGLPAGQVVDGVDRFAAALAGLESVAVPDDAGDLGGGREVEIVGGQSLHHADLLAAVALGAVVGLRCHLFPGQGVRHGRFQDRSDAVGR